MFEAIFTAVLLASFGIGHAHGKFSERVRFQKKARYINFANEWFSDYPNFKR